MVCELIEDDHHRNLGWELMKEYIRTPDVAQRICSTVLESEGIMDAMASHIRLKTTEAVEQSVRSLGENRANRDRL